MTGPWDSWQENVFYDYYYGSVRAAIARAIRPQKAEAAAAHRLSASGQGQLTPLARRGSSA
eukprot:3934831-Rhodomonas_salina.1